MAIISWYTLIGLLAQLAFMARMLVQWIMSERAHKVVNPALFWWLSLFGALTMSFYGFLRQDLAILLGQLVSFYVYIYNLKLKGELFRISKLGAVAVILTPLVLLALELRDTEAFAAIFLNQEAIPYYWLAFGMIGQFLFTFRFIYQLVVSHRSQQSVLPPKLMVQIYGIYRLDIVLILGQVGGIVTYVRNIMLARRSAHEEQAAAVEASASVGDSVTAVTAADAVASGGSATQIRE